MTWFRVEAFLSARFHKLASKFAASSPWRMRWKFVRKDLPIQTAEHSLHPEAETFLHFTYAQF